jgi:hypothetical protein
MQRDGLQPLVGLAHAHAQEVNGGHRDLGVVLDRLEQRPLRKGRRLHARDRRRLGRSLSAIEGGNLAEDAARPCVCERQFAAVAGEDRQADAPLQDQVAKSGARSGLGSPRQQVRRGCARGPPA